MNGLVRLLAGVREHALIEALLIVASVAALMFAVSTFSQASEAQAARDKAEQLRGLAQEEAAQYNIAALETELARLQATPLTGQVPTRQDAERRIGDLATLVAADPDLQLGPLTQSESSITVSNDDIGRDADTPAPRLYDALEVRVQLTGSAAALTQFLARVRVELPDVVISRVALALREDGRFGLEMDTVFYHLHRVNP
jgi:Tfp pilus assembly protein PilO